MQSQSKAESPSPRGRVPRGAIVTFSGLDGAGKSSQTTMLKQALEREEIEAVIEWVPVAINPSIEHMKGAVKRLLGVLSGAKAGEVDRDAHPVAQDPGKRLVQTSPLVRHVWSSIVTLLNVFSHWQAFLRHYTAGNVVIFDRYALDSAVRLDTWYGHLGSVEFQSWLIRKLSPRPLCSYFLDVPAERALARKTEQWDLATLSRQADVYRSECRRFGVRRLDGERSQEELAAEVSREVLAALGRKA